MNTQAARCHECGYEPSIMLVNGEEETLYCKTCGAKAVGDMVLVNDETSFRQEKRDDGLILVIAV